MRSPPVLLNPSILAADVGHLHDACRRVEDAGADQVHIDVMDGLFVPNISFGPAVVEMARKAVRLPLNVHLMLRHPDRLVDAFCDAGADTLLVHIEAEHDAAETLRRIRGHGVRPGIVLNPATGLDAVEGVLDLCDEVLFMTVNPGFGGQPFLDSPLPRITTLRERRPGLAIAVDGGLNRQTSVRCRSAGANVFDMGSALFRLPDMAAGLRALREELRSVGA